MYEPKTTKSVRYHGGRFFATLVVAASLCACQHTDKTVLGGETQGSYYSIAYYDPQHRNMQPVADSIFALMDSTASLWNDSSLLRRVNAGTTSRVNPLFDTMLRASLRMTEATEGAFDCRVGRLVQAWGFSFKQREELAPTAIDSLLQLSRGSVWLADSAGTTTVHRQYAGTELDFNAVAQGFTSDMVAAALRQHGIESFMVDVGGEVMTGQPKPDGSPWLVGIERPAANRYAERQVELVVGVANQAVVTSGSYRKYYEKGGVKYSHTIDPATGRPVQHSLLSATVVSSQAWVADAYATAFMVMGLDRALDYIARHPDNADIQAAFFIYSAPDGSYRTHATPQFEQLIVEH